MKKKTIERFTLRPQYNKIVEWRIKEFVKHKLNDK